MRNSTVFEDAADWIVGCAHADGSTKTTIMARRKDTPRDSDRNTHHRPGPEDGHGTPSTGGGDDPFTVRRPRSTRSMRRSPATSWRNPLRASLRTADAGRPSGGLVRQQPGGPSQGRRARSWPGQALAAYHQRPFTATKTGDSRVAEPRGGGDIGTHGGGGSGDSRQWESHWAESRTGHTVSHPIGDTGSGHGVREHGSRESRSRGSPNGGSCRSLQVTKNTPPPPSWGG